MTDCIHPTRRINIRGIVYCPDCGNVFMPIRRTGGAFFDHLVPGGRMPWPTNRSIKVLVCGGRKYQDKHFVFEVLDYIHSKQRVGIVVCGMAKKGADNFAVAWAAIRDVPLDPHPITDNDWLHFKKGCGNVRNQRMLILGKPDAGIAFPGEGGTANMCLLMRAVPIAVWEPVKHGLGL